MTDHTPTTAGKMEARYARDPVNGETVTIRNDLTKRLRGQYACGPTMPNGEPEFGWRTFGEPVPIQIEAANAIDANLTRITELEAEVKALREALTKLVNARALKGVRELVAGWNGEGKPHGPYERHPSQLGATLPKTNCGAVYELDEAMTRARSLIPESNDGDEG